MTESEKVAIGACIINGTFIIVWCLIYFSYQLFHK